MQAIARSIRRTFLMLLAASTALSSAAFSPAFGAGGAGEGPIAATEPSSSERLVAIPKDFKQLPQFAPRFAAVEPGTSLAHVIDLAATRFVTDPLVLRTAAGRELRPAPSANFPARLIREPFERGVTDLFIVQAPSARGQTTLHAALREKGIAVLGYLPDNAYLVRLDRAGWQRLAADPTVFWAGFFQPAWRIEPKLDFVIEMDPGHKLRMQALFDAAVHPTEESVRAAVAAAGVRVLDVVRRSGDWKVRFAGPAEAAQDVALAAGSLWVERFAPPQLHNNVARTSDDTPTARGTVDGPIMDVEDVWARGIHGEGQIAAASDTGLSTGNLATLHWDFGQVGSTTNPPRVIAAYALARPTWDDNQAQDGGHGTHTSGSIVGNGVRSGSDPSTDTYPATSYTGVAPKAGFVFQSIMNANGDLVLPGDLNTLFQTPYNDGARVHSNSWGSLALGAYTADSQEVDQFAWNNKDMVITYSAGNAGGDSRRRNQLNQCVLSGQPLDGVIDSDSIGAPGTAKNCITVGASENYRPDFVYEFPQNDCTPSGGTQTSWGWFGQGCQFNANPIFSDPMANNANGMGGFSSRGPTDDNRLKPDVVAPGVAVISTRTDLNQTYQQWGICNIPLALRPYYITLGGTSMSNPLTAGAATLVRQYYEDGWHPNAGRTTHAAPVAADGFNPSSALVKATLITGAWDMRPGQYGSGGATQELPPFWDSTHDFPNQAEGFGRVDLESSLFTGSGFGQHASRDLEVHDVTPGLQTGQFQDFTFPVGTNADDLTVTLVWTDPAATAGAGIKLVNDLDLTLTAPDGTTVYFPNGVDHTSGVLDRRNNVERTIVSAPAPGVWTARVSGFNVPGNGSSGSTTQPFALVIAGVLNLCGNNVIEAPEVCDGTALGGQTCVSQGFDGGVLACDSACGGFDTSGCVTCRQGPVEGRGWNLPVPPTNTPGWAAGYLYLDTGSFAYKMSVDLVQTAPGKGTMNGILYDGLGSDPDYYVIGEWNTTTLPTPAWDAKLVDVLTGQSVGKAAGSFRDDPSWAIVGDYDGRWKICE